MNHIEVLKLVKSLVGYEILEKDSPILQTLDHAIGVLERVEDVDRLTELMPQTIGVGGKHIDIPYEMAESIAQAIQTNLKGGA